MAVANGTVVAWVTIRQVLVGTLHGCSRSGSLLLQDSSGQLPVLPLSSLTSSSSLEHTGPEVTGEVCKLSHVQFGTKIIVTDYLAMFEKTVNLSCTDVPSSDVITYLHIISFNVISSSLPSRSLCSRSNSTGEQSSFLIGEESHNKTLFFHVLNKNSSIISSVGRLAFNCQALVHSNLDKLKPHNREHAEERKTGKKPRGDRVLQVGVCFDGEAYKWLPVIAKGCVYSLSFCSSASDRMLPSWNVLERNRTLRIDEDMEIKLVWEDLGLNGASDVMDLCCQLFLPPFPTRVYVQSTTETRSTQLMFFIQQFFLITIPVRHSRDFFLFITHSLHPQVIFGYGFYSRQNHLPQLQDRPHLLCR